MVQLSSVTFFANTLKDTPLPDLTIKFRNKVTPAGPQATQHGVQFNFLGFPVWAQPGFILTGPTDIPANALCYGLDLLPVSVWFTGAEYVVSQTANIGNLFPDTGVPPAKFLSGEVYALLKYNGGKIVMELHDSATDALVWASNPFTYTPAQLPYVGSVEVGGKYSGEQADFSQFDAEVDVMASAPIQARIAAGSGVVFGTYDDGTNGVHPLFWANETGEHSNLWTNVAGQDPQALSLDLCVTEGNQTLSNPPITPPVIVPLAINVTQTLGSLPEWHITGLKTGGRFSVREMGTNPGDLTDANLRTAGTFSDLFVYLAAGDSDSRVFRVGNLLAGAKVSLNVVTETGKTASTSFVLLPYS